MPRSSCSRMPGARGRGAARARPVADSRPIIPATGEDAKAIARAVIETFERFDYVVAPSGSCAGMLQGPLPYACWRTIRSLRQARRGARRQELRAHELSRRGARRRQRRRARFGGNVTYHDSCSSLRELKVRDAPRRLLASVDGLTLTEMEETRGVLRLRRRLLGQISRHLERHRSRPRRATSPNQAPIACSPAISAACCISPASCRATALRSSAATSRRCLPA